MTIFLYICLILTCQHPSTPWHYPHYPSFWLNMAFSSQNSVKISIFGSWYLPNPPKTFQNLPKPPEISPNVAKSTFLPWIDETYSWFWGFCRKLTKRRHDYAFFSWNLINYSGIDETWSRFWLFCLFFVFLVQNYLRIDETWRRFRVFCLKFH